MRKMLERLRSKNGSVLFLVVVVMSILILAASATYYVVTNQSSSNYVRYNNEQSYQTSMSISKAVSDYIDANFKAIQLGGGEVSGFSNTLAGKIVGGAAFASQELDLTDQGMGKVNVKIENNMSPITQGDNTIYPFKVTVTADVNGETTEISQVKYYSKGPTEYFTRFLTSTGDMAEDVVFQARGIFSEAYFENQYTLLGGSGSQTWVRESIYATGTFTDEKVYFPSEYKTDPNNFYEVVVAGNYYSNTPDNEIYHKYIMTGGDFYKGRKVGSKEVYVGGDLYWLYQDDGDPTYFVQGDAHLDAQNVSTGSTFYVYGDLYIDCGNKNGIKCFVKGNVYTKNNSNKKGNITYAGKFYNSESSDYNTTIEFADPTTLSGNYNKAGGEEEIINKTNAALVAGKKSAELEAKGEAKLTDMDSVFNYLSGYIAKKSKKNIYEDWEAEKAFNNSYRATATTYNPNTNKLTKADGTEMTGADNFVTYNIDGNAYDVPVISRNCILKSFNESTKNKIIYIDTNKLKDANSAGEAGTDNVMYIYLEPNGDTFSFGEKTCVLIKGPLAVIFILPEGKNIKMNSSLVFHEDIVKKIYQAGGQDYNSQFLQQVKGQTSLFDQFLNSSKFDTTKDQLAKKYILNKYQVNSKATASILVEESELTKLQNDVVPGFQGEFKFAHNNIFMVQKGANGVLDFTGSCFGGFIYANKASMVSSSTTARLSFLGGLLIGSYKYLDMDACVVFTSPYDYFDLYTGGNKSNRNDIVKKLIAKCKKKAGTSGGGGGSSDDKIIDFGVIGYE